jgi:hypothetical protein
VRDQFQAPAALSPKEGNPKKLIECYVGLGAGMGTLEKELFPCRKRNHDMVISTIGRAVSFTSELSDQASQLLLMYAGSHM